MILAVVFITFSSAELLRGIQGVIITEPSEKTVAVAYRQEVILWCNFSYTATENGNTRIEAQLNLNGTGQAKSLYMYEQNGGRGGNTNSPHLLNHFQSRTDIEELREPMAIGLKIKQAQWNDSGNYTWSMVVDRSLATAQTNVHTNNLIVGSTFTFTHTYDKSGVTQGPDDPGKTAGIVIGTLLGLLVAVTVAGFVLYKRLYKKESLLPDRKIFGQRKQKANNDHVYEMPVSVLDAQPYTEVSAGDQVRELTANEIRLLETIGHGHFGEVYKAMLKNIKSTNAEKPVAVKLLKEQYSEVDKKEFFREIETMELVPQHENVVAMLGFCKTAARAFLVLEYLGNGNLKTYLRKSRSNNIYGNLHGGSGKLSSQNLLSFALDSARGMAHIARYKFLHRDLAARNILVSDDMVCKVSDFGLARDVIDSREYLSRMETPLPIRWMAPESISDSVYTTKSDVWSLGVLLWEIVTLGATPYPGITSGRELIREIRSGYRMEKPQHCTQELYNMMMMCWEEEPTERPTFDNLVTSLTAMANEEMKLHVDVDRAAEAIYCDIDSQLVGEIV